MKVTKHIAFDGIDNAGKTTTAELLCTSIRDEGMSCVVTKEFESEYGVILKDRLYSGKTSPLEKLYAFCLDRQLRYEALQNSEYDYIIWDRYILSSIIYRHSEGIDEELVTVANTVFPKPYLYYYLDVSPEESIKRGKKSGKGCPYNMEFLSECRENYLKFLDTRDLIQLGEDIPENVSYITNQLLNENNIGKK